MIKIDSTFNSKITLKSNCKVSSKSVIEIIGTNTQLEIEHTADFSRIPVEFHQIYLESLHASLYDSKVFNNAKNNEPMNIKEKKRDWRLNRIVDIISEKIR